MSRAFQSRLRACIRDIPTIFNGVKFVVTKNSRIKMIREKMKGKLKIPTAEQCFLDQMAFAKYFGVSCQPDICAPVQPIALANPKTEERKINALRMEVNHMKEMKEKDVDFARQDIESVCVVVISDGSFANRVRLENQVAFGVLLVDTYQCADIVHHSSSRCHRITRSVMAAEMLVLVPEFD